MKIKYWLFCLRLNLSILCFYLLSCSSTINNDIVSFNVPKEGDSGFQLSNLSKSIEYIALETNEDSFLKLIQDLKFYKDKVFVLDFTSKILVFDRSGKFLYRLGNSGDGPGEFSSVSSFVIDEQTETVHIASLNRLISYSLENEYLVEKKVPFFIDYIDVINKKISLIAGNDGIKYNDKYVNQRSLFFMDKDLKISDSIPLLYIELDKETAASYPYKNYISKVNNENFIYTPVLVNESIIRDTLFNLVEKTLIPYLKLNFAPPLMNNKGNKLVVVKNVILSENYLLCEYIRNGRNMSFIGNRNNEFSINLTDGFLIDDEEVIQLRPFDLSKDQFYFIKTYNFSNISNEELNPLIGIVSLQ
ncbi:6-bladed beta-propeller protein [Algoriphagus ratkowskyi]|nr:6-bladed beta-propeller [Algoriphagus ratkowskyi]PZX49106.1 6-bladed beta-propeller protein [Algoriphagus ratkowskyi]